MTDDPRLLALPDIHGHAKGEHKPFADERPIPYSARLMFLWFYHAARRGAPRFMMVTDHINYLTFEDPAAVNLVRRALRLALAGDLYGTAETAGVDILQATTVSEALRSGMRFTIGAEVDNDPRSRPDAPNVVDAMRPDGIIRSVHFLPLPQANSSEDFFWPFDNPEFISYYEQVGVERTWEMYVDLLAEAVATQPTHILGHFYVPGKFGHWPEDATLERYEDRILEICKERNIAMEFNSRIFYRSNDEALKAKHIELYSRMLRKCKDHGVGVALGSDAHSPKDQGRGFDILLPLIDAAEINEIVFPINGQHARVALRVDRISRSVTKPLMNDVSPEKRPHVHENTQGASQEVQDFENLANETPSSNDAVAIASLNAAPEPETAPMAKAALAAQAEATVRESTADDGVDSAGDTPASAPKPNKAAKKSSVKAVVAMESSPASAPAASELPASPTKRSGGSAPRKKPATTLLATSPAAPADGLELEHRAAAGDEPAEMSEHAPTAKAKSVKRAAAAAKAPADARASGGKSDLEPSEAKPKTNSVAADARGAKAAATGKSAPAKKVASPKNAEPAAPAAKPPAAKAKTAVAKKAAAKPAAKPAAKKKSPAAKRALTAP